MYNRYTPINIDTPMLHVVHSCNARSRSMHWATPSSETFRKYVKRKKITATDCVLGRKNEHYRTLAHKNTARNIFVFAAIADFYYLRYRVAR